MTIPPRTRRSPALPLPLEGRALRPTAPLATVYVLVWLIAPLVLLLAMPFGGKPPEPNASDVFGLLTDQRALADYFFDGPAYEVLVIVAIITVAGWWRVLQFEPTPLRPRAFAIVPWATACAFALTAILGIAATPEPSGSLIVLQVIAMGGIVFQEEIGWRGVVLVGLRGSRVPEWAAWLITSAGFAAMHLLNLISGADLPSTLSQLLFTFVLGTACYLARRAGGLWLAIAVHFTNNFLQMAAQGSAGSPLFGVLNAFAAIGQILLFLSVPATIIVLILEARRARRAAPAAVPEA